jgi:predicted cobalt transporter CbtA
MYLLVENEIMINLIFWLIAGAVVGWFKDNKETNS